MPDFPTLSLFLTATVIFAITPGPGILYVLARSLKGGKSEGIQSSFGTCVGGMLHVIAAAAGISAILATSALVFSIVKYAGAAYLIYLGLRIILSPDTTHLPQASTIKESNAFFQGIITEVLNPKTALFFLAFIPQFIQPELGSAFWQFALFGCITVSCNTLVDLLVASLSGPIAKGIQTSYRLRRTQKLFSGGTLIGLGTSVALADTN